MKNKSNEVICLANVKVNYTFFLHRLFSVMVLLLISYAVTAAPKKQLLTEWQGSDEASELSVNHQQWQAILDRYVIEENQQTYVNYAQMQRDTLSQKMSPLDNYINYLTSINPLQLTRRQQFAYWVNLYNAATVQLVLQHYPVKSITTLGKGFFSFGPWNDEILTVNQRPLSLNDIEHGILRPIYDDPRIHYAVNCASISCPNLQSVAFTAENVERLLDKAAREYINHPRGVMVDGQQLVLSTIYEWYQTDFAGTVEGVLTHLNTYADPELQSRLQGADQAHIRYEYDWQLNEIRPLP